MASHSISETLLDRRQSSGLPNTQVLSAVQDQFGIQWFPTVQGIFQIRPLSSRFLSWETDPDGRTTTVSGLQEPFEYRPDKILLSYPEGLKIFDWKRGTLEPFPEQPTKFLKYWSSGSTCYHRDNNNILWIGTNGGGLFSYDEITGTFQHKLFGGEDAFLSGLNVVRDITTDGEYIWVASWNAGVVRMHRSSQRIKHYIPDPGDSGAISGYSVRRFFWDRGGGLWVGTRQGLNRYHPRSDSFEKFLIDPTGKGLSEGTVFHMYEDRDSNLWLGTYGGGLNRMNMRTKEFTYFSLQEAANSNTIFCIYPDKNENLWLGTFSGLWHFDTRTLEFRKYSRDDGLLNNAFEAFGHFKSPYSGHIFLESSSGMDIFHPDSVLLDTHPPRMVITEFSIFNQPVSVASNDVERSNPDAFYLDQVIEENHKLNPSP